MSLSLWVVDTYHMFQADVVNIKFYCESRDELCELQYDYETEKFHINDFNSKYHELTEESSKTMNNIIDLFRLFLPVTYNY